MVYILVKDGEPCFAGNYKYNIRHKYEKMSQEEQAKVTPYMGRNNGEVVKKDIPWLLLDNY